MIAILPYIRIGGYLTVSGRSKARRLLLPGSTCFPCVGRRPPCLSDLRLGRFQSVAPLCDCRPFPRFSRGRYCLPSPFGRGKRLEDSVANKKVRQGTIQR